MTHWTGTSARAATSTRSDTAESLSPSLSIRKPRERETG